MSEHIFENKYRREEDNTMADALSRRPDHEETYAIVLLCSLTVSKNPLVGAIQAAYERGKIIKPYSRNAQLRRKANVDFRRSFIR